MYYVGRYEHELGMGDEPTYGSRLGATVVTGVLGAVVAYIVAEHQYSDVKVPVIGGALAAVAAGAISQAILPVSGFLYWARAIMAPAGAGALVGLYVKRQFKRELEYSVHGRLPASARARR